jgi:hypothetical protein
MINTNKMSNMMSMWHHASLPGSGEDASHLLQSLHRADQLCLGQDQQLWLLAQ